MTPARVQALDEARSIAASMAQGDELSSQRNRLRQLDEAVSKGNALSVDGMMRRLNSRRSRASWSEVYTEHERDIRAHLHGRLTEIVAGLPDTRFRVLASKHAPDDPERYRTDVVESLGAVLDKYEELANKAGALIDEAIAAPTGYLDAANGLIESNIRGFLTSLQSSSAFLVGDGRAILGEEAAGGALARLARFHDLLADGLEDFTLAFTYASDLATASRSQT